MTCTCRCHSYGPGTHVTCDIDGGFGVGCGPHNDPVDTTSDPDHACPGPCNRDFRANGDTPGAEVKAIPGAPIWCEACSRRLHAVVDDLPELYLRLEGDMAGRTRLADLGSIRGSGGHPTPSAQVDLQDETVRLVVDLEDTIRDARPNMAARVPREARPTASAGRWTVETLPPGIFGPPRLLDASTARLRPASTRWRSEPTDRTLVTSARFVKAHLDWWLERDENGRDGRRLLNHHARLRTATATGSGVSRRTQRCPRCGVRSLVQEPGSDYLCCEQCNRLVSLDEYAELVTKEADAS